LAEQLVADYPQYRFDKRRAVNPNGHIVHTLQAVFQSFFEKGDFESTPVDVVNRGGDADTTGAIAGMLAVACYGLQSTPSRWTGKLNPQEKMACQRQTLELLEAV
jgi:ADP-ribosyl-[dinitrogen reductase] hydrolase